MKMYKVIWFGLVALVLCVAEPASAALLAHYKLDGDATDSASGGSDGIATGEVSYVQGKVGLCGSFGGDGLGEGEITALTNTPFAVGNTMSNFTAMAWVKGGSSIRYLMGNYTTTGDGGRGFDIWVRPSDSNVKIAFYGTSSITADNLWATGLDIPTEAWMHLAFTLDTTAETINIYTNGVLAATKATVMQYMHSMSPEPNPLKIGQRGTGSFGNWEGEIDEVKIWDEALSEVQIAAEAAISPPGSDLLGHWKLDAINAGTTPDSSTYGSDGTITGTVSLVAGKVYDAASFPEGGNTNDYIYVAADTPQLFTSYREFTAMAWFKLYDNPTKVLVTLMGKMGAVDGERGWEVWVSPVGADWAYPNSIRFSLYGESDGVPNQNLWVQNINPPLPYNEWMHLAVTFEATNSIVMYLNGKEIGNATTTLTQLTMSNNGTFDIGSRGSPNDFRWKGEIDDVMLYSRALSESEILATFPPSRIISLQQYSSDVVKMVVDCPAPSASYPFGKNNLVVGDWGRVAHSTNGVDSFIEASLDYSATSEGNKVIYLQATNSSAFFGIGEE